jgi:hypothetical protein
MPRFHHKWLPLILAFALGVVPFARVFADAPPALTSPSGHVAMQHAAMDDNSCEGCTTAHSCGTSSCSCYQCSTCSVTILHESLTIHFASLAAQRPTSAASQLTDFPSLLFRPPRA